MRTKLWSLTLGNFAIGTGVLIVPGMLNELALDLASTPAQIGQLISIFALTICVAGPVLAGWTSAMERRTLLTAALLLYAVMHVLAAFAPNYGALLAARLVTALGAAIFTAQAAATAGLLVAPEVRGKAISLVLLGWTIAAVFGMPIGSYLGAHIGWRWTMALEGLLAALCAAWLWWQIPARLYVAPMDGAAWKALFGNRPLLLVVAATALQGAGQFTVFAYMALVFKDFILATPLTISLLYGAFGVAGLIGNILSAQVMDRLGTARVAMAAMLCIALAMLLWPLAHNSLPLMASLVLLWGLGCFAINSAQQTRLVSMAPKLASASVALNSSAIYLGQAFGAVVGGVIISIYGTGMLSMVGVALVMAAMLVSQTVSALEKRSVIAAPTN